MTFILAILSVHTEPLPVILCDLPSHSLASVPLSNGFSGRDLAANPCPGVAELTRVLSPLPSRIGEDAVASVASCCVQEEDPWLWLRYESKLW